MLENSVDCVKSVQSRACLYESSTSLSSILIITVWVANYSSNREWVDMRLTRLAIFASVFTEAKKQQPTYVDCVSNGLTIDMKNVDETSCDNKNRCQVRCQDGYTALGAKYFKCRRTAKSKILRMLHPYFSKPTAILNQSL